MLASIRRADAPFYQAGYIGQAVLVYTWLGSMKNRFKRLMKGLWGDYLLLAAICALVFFTRLQSFTETTVNWDESLYLCIAQDMANGGVPYKTSWDHKGPLLYAAYAPVTYLFGNDIVPMRAYHTLTVILGVAVLYFLSRRLMGPVVALIPPLAYGLFANSPYVEGNAIGSENTMMTPVIIAAYFFTEYHFGPKRRLSMFFFGFFAALAAFVKPTALFTLAAFPLFSAAWGLFGLARTLWGSRRGKCRGYGGKVSEFLRGTAREYAMICAGGILVLVAVLAYFWVNDAVGDFVFGYFTFNSRYSSEFDMEMRLGMLAKFAGRALFGSTQEYTTFGAFIGLVILIARPGSSERERMATCLVLMTLVLSLLGTNWGGRMYDHYYFQMSLAFALVMGLAVSRLRVDLGDLKLVFGAVVVFYLIVCLWTHSGAIKNIMDGGYRSARLYVIGEYLANSTKPGDTILQLGDDNYIYFYAHRRPASRYTSFYFHHSLGQMLPNIINVSLTEVGRNRPAYIIGEGPDYLNRYRDEHYTFVRKVAGFDVYKRNDLVAEGEAAMNERGDAAAGIKAPSNVSIGGNMSALTSERIKELTDIAVGTGSPNGCLPLKAEDPESYAKCVTVVAVTRANVEICDLLREDADSFDNCVLQLAVTRSNDAMCDRLEGDGFAACVTELAVASANVFTCNKIKGTRLYGDCVTRLAVTRANADLCNNLLGEDSFNVCVTRMAVSRAQKSLCERLKDSGGYGMCLEAF